ncbi:hypothetical protein diail_11840 [Diaporthe ilicicola]|nr:hypothetical protein diail_11840 [Diaporthe ilicicola]
MHERLLQTCCNYTGGMPYSDEAADAEYITLSAVCDSVYGIGGDGNSSANDIVTDGPFAYMGLHVGPYAFNTMQNAVLSPGDPVFFLHHNNLDRLWWEWQSANLTARLTDMGGNNTPSDESNAANNWDAPGANFTDYSGDPANVMSLFEILPNVTIADVMDIGGDTICAEFV